jgi:hypothetical protein
MDEEVGNQDIGIGDVDEEGMGGEEGMGEEGVESPPFFGKLSFRHRYFI